MEPVKALATGNLAVVSANQGSLVEKNDIIGFIA
jgi:hypothetical protein